ncbi:hypothetical protein [Maridesulfovibrio sp. FT414]|uniref:hypothetical protein n=1 Tax=Maridesulfovibrio sp. FT414 TaxID=2979469 RepID=UPI003D801918
MNSRRLVTLFCGLILTLVLSSAAVAQDQKAVPDSKPKQTVAVPEVKQEAAGIPVVVEHLGNDELGGTLALKLKENFRKSVLFKFADKSEKGVRIKVVSRSEFSERPEIGSVYAVVWTFAESQDVVPFYLAEELGLVSQRNVESAASALMNRTDKIAEEYKYLF